MHSLSNKQLRVLSVRYCAETERDLNEALAQGLDPATEYRQLLGAISEASKQPPNCIAPLVASCSQPSKAKDAIKCLNKAALSEEALLTSQA